MPGRPTILNTVGQGPTALAVGAGGGCLDIFTLIYPFSSLSPSLWETARYRLKYYLKGPLNPKQPTNQPTLKEHLEHLKIIFSKLRQHKLKLKLKKCSFLKLETNYLGFVIGEEGFKPDEKKIEAIRSLPVPTCVREVRSFIGMCSYYRRFIPNFSQIAEPIICLTRKYAHFKWSDTHQKVFEFLKDSWGWSGGAMVLGKIPVPGRPTILITVGQGPVALAVGAGGGGLDIFTLIYPFSSFSLSLGDGPI